MTDKINWPTQAEVRASFPSPPGFGATIRMMPVADHEAEIARLTAELHEVKADLAWMQNNRDRWQDSATQRHFRAEKAEAERDAALAGSVKVKPLVWPDFREGGTCGRPHHFQYFVTQDRHGRFWAHFDMSQHDNLDDAKRHCDRHYQRAALQPDPDARQADLSDAARDVLAERARQISVEGWTPGHDDMHEDGEMAEAAGCYALNAAGWKTEAIRGCWPIKWMAAWFKPTDPRRDLVKAGALCIAEIERLDRALTPPADMAAKIGGE